MIKLYDRVKHLLELNPLYRNSDNELKWQIWMDTGVVINGCITKDRFLSAVDSESIRRTRQKVQEAYPELKATGEVLEMRETKEKMGDLFVYQEKIELSVPELQKQLEALRLKWVGKVPEKGQDGYFKFRADKLKAERIKQDILAKSLTK